MERLKSRSSKLLLLKPRAVAAVLALAGWYLLLPPPASDDPAKIDPMAPITTWIQVGSFATLHQCKTVVKGNVRTVASPRQGNPETTTDFRLFQCVASNDPRLAR
jgi:hypothetical protein